MSLSFDPIDLIMGSYFMLSVVMFIKNRSITTAKDTIVSGCLLGNMNLTYFPVVECTPRVESLSLLQGDIGMWDPDGALR